MKVKRHFTFPQQIRKVRKKMFVITLILRVLFGKRRMRCLRHSWLRIRISTNFLEKCFMFKTTIIAFRLGDHTLRRTIPMNLISRSRSIICFGHNKWLGWTTYSYDWHKQVNFHCQCSFFFHICQMVSWCLTFLFLASPSRLTTWSHQLFMISSTFNPLEWFHSTNLKKSFQMPNTRNAKIKSRRFNIASHRWHFLNICIR